MPGITIATKKAIIATIGNDEKVVGGGFADVLIAGLEGFESFRNQGR